MKILYSFILFLVFTIGCVKQESRKFFPDMKSEYTFSDSTNELEKYFSNRLSHFGISNTSTSINGKEYFECRNEFTPGRICELFLRNEESKYFILLKGRDKKFQESELFDLNAKVGTVWNIIACSDTLFSISLNKKLTNDNKNDTLNIFSLSFRDLESSIFVLEIDKEVGIRKMIVYPQIPNILLVNFIEERMYTFKSLDSLYSNYQSD